MFDYVIVGAGSAGCVLANRLSADPGVRVLLVEAGGPDRHPLFRVPKGFGKLMDDPRKAWHYQTRPFGPRARPEVWPRGKVLGGSSSINGLVYNRGGRDDWDDLVRLGNPGWGWDTILPIFRGFEDNIFGSSASRGAGGPLGISPPRTPDPLSVEMVETGRSVGLTPVRDVNDAEESEGERIGHTMATIRDGRRVSAATAFLRPVRHRPNLTVRTGTTVTGLVFGGDKVVGVRARDASGATVEFPAAREVVLSLGSLGTPKLLQQSGIGPAEVLRAAGVDVRLDRELVGARMREHRCLPLKFRLRENLGTNRMLSSPARQGLTALRYLVRRDGPLATPAYDVLAFMKSRPELDRPDAQVLMGPWSVATYQAGEAVTVEREPGLSAVAEILRPTAEGIVRITSADPDAPLDVEPNYLGSEHDRRIAVDVLARMREFFAHEPIAARLATETFPGPGVRTDEDVIDTMLDSGYCGYHAIGTCAMGPADTDVVDSRLRVRGVDNLRVMDASVLPAMVSGNLNGPVMAMAWHAADLILQRA
ncbi:GMC family oxidoreductase [Actinopolymorpha singaporensis]|uniref:Choline dehydrogenase n=1 Tax=Actinopolymorpha singaporensis TaxID=117157 RepID=A0A1H1S8F3_9ACTN|nr:GMC family oxidoreductase N-terminal domain-containing protein [Actinopolymorpha singaporensis]SDS43579.1 Choline dehydrogenase [Actinopolymorpha singaporensis]